MELFPRHQRIIDHLTANPNEKLTIRQLSPVVKIAQNTLRNELPRLTSMGLVSRIQSGREFYYFISPHQPNNFPTAPLNRDEIGESLVTIRNFPDYTPAVVNQGWKFPQALADIALATVENRLPDSSILESLVSTLRQALNTSQRFLATEQLWLTPGWLAEGFSETQLRDLEELSRQLSERYAKLNPSAHQAQQTT